MGLLVPVGRFLFSLIFIMSGIDHFVKMSDMVGYSRSMGAPFPEITVPLAGLMILVGGLSILLGYRAKIGAWLIVVFLIPTSFIMHRFWGLGDPMMAQNQMVHFMKNVSMLGAALFFTQMGSGSYSLDKKKKRS